MTIFTSFHQTKEFWKSDHKRLRYRPMGFRSPPPTTGCFRNVDLIRVKRLYAHVFYLIFRSLAILPWCTQQWRIGLCSLNGWSNWVVTSMPRTKSITPHYIWLRCIPGKVFRHLLRFDLSWPQFFHYGLLRFGWDLMGVHIEFTVEVSLGVCWGLLRAPLGSSGSSLWGFTGGFVVAWLGCDIHAKNKEHYTTLHLASMYFRQCFLIFS